MLKVLALVTVAGLGLADVSTFASASSAASAGGNAHCRSGKLRVQVNAENVKLLYDGPPNSTILTSTFNDLLSPGNTLAAKVQGGPSQIAKAYDIWAQLCFPTGSGAESVKSVQLLTHGGSLNSLYWDIDGSSYIDAAGKAGYATLSYDRLGAGKSEHPDPIQEVQAAVEIEIVHQLTQALRKGRIDGSRKFDTVVGTAHSSGNIPLIGQILKYPKDYDAVIVTGFTISAASMAATLAANAAADIPAAETGDPRYRNLPNGYYVQSTAQAIQFLYFHFPYYSLKAFELLVANRDTQSVGGLFTLGSAVAPTKFTGPVDVVVGEYDAIFCGGNCNVPSDLSAAVQPALFPSAKPSSQHYVVPNSGHVINAHATANMAYDQIFSFLTANGLQVGVHAFDKEKREL